MSQAVADPGTAVPGAKAGDVSQLDGAGHVRWVRISHWIVALSVLTLAFSGFVILMAHPRLYWGAAGNDLTPALLELPVSRNYQHGGWEQGVPFSTQNGAPLSAVRTYDIFNQNGWGRSLHFLAAWFLTVTGAVYFFSGIISGHFRRHLLLRGGELGWHRLREDLASHLRRRIQPYGIVQKISYCLVIFLALPLMVMTGMTMSPAITAAYPILLDVFGGSQSARTIHFFVFAGIVTFVAVHVLMVVLSGFRRQLRAMILGS
jgi:thiosulfate reductase cytochrome b subunit